MMFFYLLLLGGRSAGRPHGGGDLRLHQTIGRRGVHCRGDQSLLQRTREATVALFNTPTLSP